MNKIASPRLTDPSATMKRCANVCRNLFGVGPMDNITNLKDLSVIRACVDERSIKRWNFDFRLGRPLPAADGPSKSYEWTPVDNVENEHRTPVKQMLQENLQSFRTPVKQSASENVVPTPNKPVFNTPRATSHTVLHKPYAPLAVETFAPAINFNFASWGTSSPSSTAATPTRRRHTIAVVSPPPTCGYFTPEKAKSVFGVSTPKTGRKVWPIQESRMLALAAASPKGGKGLEPKRLAGMEKKRKRTSSNYFPRKKRCSQRLIKSSMGSLQRMH